MHIIFAALIIAAAIGGGGTAVAAPLSPIATTCIVLACAGLAVNGIWFMFTGSGIAATQIGMLMASIPMALWLSQQLSP